MKKILAGILLLMAAVAYAVGPTTIGEWTSEGPLTIGLQDVDAEFNVSGTSTFNKADFDDGNTQVTIEGDDRTVLVIAGDRDGAGENGEVFAMINMVDRDSGVVNKRGFRIQAARVQDDDDATEITMSVHDESGVSRDAMKFDRRGFPRFWNSSAIGSATNTWCADATGTDTTQLVRTCTSSKRYKHDIKSLEAGESDKIHKLRAVSFVNNGTDKPDYGLIAEEVNEIYPRLVSKDQHDRPEAVNYRHMIALVIDQLQKEKKRADLLQQWVCLQADAPSTLCEVE